MPHCFFFTLFLFFKDYYIKVGTRKIISSVDDSFGSSTDDTYKYIPVLFPT